MQGHFIIQLDESFASHLVHPNIGRFSFRISFLFLPYQLITHRAKNDQALFFPAKIG
jgi:hypothetical protein